MSESIILRTDPRIEFQLHDSGFELIDGRPEGSSGSYPYQHVRSVELNKPWYPRLAKWLRVLTWVLNGVPYFPDAATCKKASLIIRSKKAKLGIWLTDPHMADKARRLKGLLDERVRATA
jgi:hypothetical protein